MQLYEIGRSIGVGSFGQVFLCKHRQQDKYYVVKKLRMIDISDKDKQNIENQLKLLQKLRHTNIISYKDSFRDNQGNLYIVMIYCQGGDMFGKIRMTKQKAKNFTESQILDWLVQIALAIYYLHNQKILHRDLKPQNIFLKNQRVRLGDFGISKMLDSTQDLASTCIGTPFYMAPEVFRYKPYSYKSDIWSLGCILYQMCNLRRAFDAQNYNALAIKILKGSFPSITATYSKGLRDLIIKMLSVNPSDRPTIVQILNKPFIKKRVEKYMLEIFNRNYPQANNPKDVDDIYIDTLREQAVLLDINLTTTVQQDSQLMKKYPSSKDLMQRNRFGNKHSQSKRGQQQNDIDQKKKEMNEKRKSVHDKEGSSYSLDKNMNKKQDTSTTASTKALNLLTEQREQKDAFIDHKKKVLLERERKKLEEQRKKNEELKTIASENQKNRIAAQNRLQNEYHHKHEDINQKPSKKFQVQEQYSMDEEQDYPDSDSNPINEEIILEESEQDLLQLTKQQSGLNQSDEEVPEEYNSSYYKLLDRIKLLKHKSQAGIGPKRYKRAYEIIEQEGGDRQKLIEILGNDQIGYWHLIDQILFYESILKIMPKK